KSRHRLGVESELFYRREHLLPVGGGGGEAVCGATRVRSLGLGSSSQRQKRRALGDYAETGATDEGRRIFAAHRCEFESRRRAPGHSRNRLRFGSRYDYAAAFGAQSRRIRARSVTSRALDRRKKRRLRIR